MVLNQAVGKSEEQHIEKLYVSSVILAAHSDYFMRMFSNGMSESSSENAVVHVNEEGTLLTEKCVFSVTGPCT